MGRARTMAVTTADDYALYRYFDHGDRLLYIGISGDLAMRETAHIGRSRWMRLVGRSTVERRATLEEALEAEQHAIEAEHPLFNRQHNDTPDAMERLRLYLDEIGRPDLFPGKATIRASPTSEMRDCGVADRTLMSSGDYRLEVKHGAGIVLRISSGGWDVMVPLDSGTAFGLSDALKHHATEHEFAFLRRIPGVAGTWPRCP
jgi:hypothetical protein